MMKTSEGRQAVDLRQFTAAMIAAAAELGIVRPVGPQLRPVPVKAADARPRGGDRI